MIRVSQLPLFAGLLFCALGPAWAQSVPDTCDVNFQDLMETRAWMEAQRETEVAETLIQKPESVLGYACITDSVNGAKGISIFHEDISGRINSVMSGATLTCGAMADIAETMRCTDADKSKILPTFDQLVSGDLRPSCSSSDRDNSWTQADALVNVDPIPRALDAGGLDAVDLQRAKNTTNDCSNSAVFISGIDVDYNVIVSSDSEDRAFEGQGQTKVDGVCLAAGCYFNGSTCVSG